MLSATGIQMQCYPNAQPTAYACKAPRSAAVPYYSAHITDQLPSPTFLPTPPLTSPLSLYTRLVLAGYPIPSVFMLRVAQSVYTVRASQPCVFCMRTKPAANYLTPPSFDPYTQAAVLPHAIPADPRPPAQARSVQRGSGYTTHLAGAADRARGRLPASGNRV